jgi:hypothetical protein
MRIRIAAPVVLSLALVAYVVWRRRREDPGSLHSRAVRAWVDYRVTEHGANEAEVLRDLVIQAAQQDRPVAHVAVDDLKQWQAEDGMPLSWHDVEVDED